LGHFAEIPPQHNAETSSAPRLYSVLDNVYVVDQNKDKAKEQPETMVATKSSSTVSSASLGAQKEVSLVVNNVTLKQSHNNSKIKGKITI